jgi:hypothetical protein
MSHDIYFSYCAHVIPGQESANGDRKLKWKDCHHKANYFLTAMMELYKCIETDDNIDWQQAY